MMSAHQNKNIHNQKCQHIQSKPLATYNHLTDKDPLTGVDFNLQKICMIVSEGTNLKDIQICDCVYNSKTCFIT